MKVACMLRKAELPVLDVGSGFGRNAVALALLGLDVVCADCNPTRLTTQVKIAPEYIEKMKPKEVTGELYPICTTLSAFNWPFSPNCFSAILCIHFLDTALFPFFRSSLGAGGYLYVETFGGHGQNYLDLPRAGLLRELLSSQFQLLHYWERKVGPADCDAVSVRLFAQRV